MSEQPVSANLKEQLVAYLDGELDEEGMREVESLLSTDPRARQALRQLETAWDLLEELPRAEVDQSFTESTIEIVAVSLEKDLEQEQAAGPRRELRNWTVAAAAVVAACVLGFFVISSLLVDPNEQLLRNLPLLERLDQYLQVEDVQFLRELHAGNVLKDVQPQTEEPTSLADRQMLVEQMDPAAKELLEDKAQRFAGLPDADRARLLRVHEELQKDANVAQLRGTMSAYSEWLLKLSPPQRASLASLDTSARVDKVKSLRGEEIRRTADKAEPADLETIAAWAEKQVYQRMPEKTKASIDALVPDDRRGATLLWAMSPRPPGSPSRHPEINTESIADLRQTLSAEGKAKLDALGSDEKRRNALSHWGDGWVWQAMRENVRRYFDALVADVSQEEFLAYFEKFSEKQKEDLAKVSTEYKDHRVRISYALEHRKDRLPEYAHYLKPEMLIWLRGGRGWPWPSYRGRDSSRGEGLPAFMAPPQQGPPGSRRPGPG